VILKWNNSVHRLFTMRGSMGDYKQTIKMMKWVANVHMKSS